MGCNNEPETNRNNNPNDNNPNNNTKNNSTNSINNRRDKTNHSNLRNNPQKNNDNSENKEINNIIIENINIKETSDFQNYRKNVDKPNNTIIEEDNKNEITGNTHQINNEINDETKSILKIKNNNVQNNDIKKKEKLIGEGGFGDVYIETIEYKDENGNDKIVAAKYIILDNNNNTNNYKTKILTIKNKKNIVMNLFKEAGFMVNLFHKNIVKLISIHFSEYKIIMEYMKGGNLTKVIYNNKNLPLTFKIHCLFDICDGLKFLHDRKIIHGDLKSLNILLEEEYNGEENYPTLKLTDFGLSGIKENIIEGETPGFSAPELYQKGKRTIKSDIFSFGVVIYEIFKGESPNENRRTRIKKEKDKNIYYPLPDISKEKWPKEIKKLILECCNEDSDKRPDVENIKKEISEFCQNSNDIKLIELKNKALKNVNYNIVNLNAIACQLFEKIKAVYEKQYGKIIYKINNIPLTGFGTYIFEDKTKYFGLFKDGHVNEYGKFSYSNGITYEGQHYNGIWNGVGKFEYKIFNIKYNGYFKNFTFDKFGIISTIQKNKGSHKYIGEFEGGKQNGIGIYTDPENKQYLGEWKNGNFGGRGTFTYPDGEICQGEFENGIRQGFCYIKYADGSHYEGHFDKGRFNGYGQFSNKKGIIYEGQWENGQPINENKIQI